jgi:hypothetical protein
MLLEILRPVSFFLSLLSLYPVLMGAFFEPGSRWEDRMWMALARVGFAACICFASGILYSWPGPTPAERGESVLTTLPVRVFFWAMVGVALLFVLSWYLDVYYVPLARRDCCHL